MNPTSDSPIANLHANLNGNVIAPDDPGYDEARQVFFNGFDRRPAAVVRPTTPPTSPVSSTWHGRRASSSRSAAAATAAPATAPPTAVSSSTSRR